MFALLAGKQIRMKPQQQGSAFCLLKANKTEILMRAQHICSLSFKFKKGLRLDLIIDLINVTAFPGNNEICLHPCMSGVCLLKSLVHLFTFPQTS